MSRFRRAIHGVFSSYVLLAATAVYSLASVSVAFHYLDVKRFSLWIIMGTLAGFLNLIDAGMTSAMGRLLIDHKDDRNNENYGSLLKTAWLVSALQGAIIFLAGLLLTGPLIRLLAISDGLQPEFAQLIHWQCGVLALMFSTRIFAQILQAHQRMDLANYSGAFGLAVNFVTQWVFFHFNFGVLSLALGSLGSTLFIVIFQGCGCLALKLFPHPGSWGQITWRRFRELFDFGKDFFLVSVGNQLIMASQVFVISRMLGPEAVTIWGIGLRVFNLLNQVIWRISDMSVAAFAEMLTRGEVVRVRERYQTICMVSISLSATAAVSFALCNSLFIPIWTHGKTHWPAEFDLLLGGWMVLLAVTHCHNNLILLTKQMRFMRFIFFVEGAVFVALSCLVVRWCGLGAIIACSLACGTVFTGVYSVWRVSNYFGIAFGEVALAWLRPAFKLLLYYAPCAALAWWVLSPLPGLTRLAANALLALCLGTYLFLHFGIPETLKNELLRRVPARLAPILKRVFHQSRN
jgi:O-antigen/teichoic acid export membrane protein